VSDSQRPEPAAVAEPVPAASEPDPRRWKALVALSVTALMVTLDAQIVILALPSIESDLHISPAAGQWALSAYMLPFGGLLLFGGRLADLRGRRQMFMVGAALFLASSLLCGLAGSAPVLIGARVLQGISAALMSPSALAILMTMFPVGAERNKALGIWSGLGGIGASAALLVGGPITDTLGWEWIFFVNIPVAVGLLIFAPILLLESRDPGQRAYDPAGAFTSTVALMLLIGAIVWAPTKGWVSGPVIAMLVAAVALLALFVLIESRSAAPLLPLRIFRSRPFVGGNAGTTLIAMITVGMSVAITSYTQEVLGWTPLKFGLGMLALTLANMVGAWTGQAAMTKIGFRLVAVSGTLLLIVAVFLLSRVPVDGTYLADLFPGLLIYGFGMGFGLVAVFAAALSSAEPEIVGVASGVANASFQIGGALGAAIISAVAVSFGAGSADPVGMTEGFQAGLRADLLIVVVCLLTVLLVLQPVRRKPAE
jgi:EmrB/QacA subfamily drug resistance transporter